MLFKKKPFDFAMAVHDYLLRKKPKYFRWHVAGELQDAWHLALIQGLAYVTPGSKFLLFTKRYDLLAGAAEGPKNLQVIMSMWPGYPAPMELKSFRKAWLYDPANIDSRIPDNAVECGGSCENCKFCFEPNNKDVVFAIH